MRKKAKTKVFQRKKKEKLGKIVVIQVLLVEKKEGIITNIKIKKKSIDIGIKKIVEIIEVEVKEDEIKEVELEV